MTGLGHLRIPHDPGRRICDIAQMSQTRQLVMSQRRRDRALGRFHEVVDHRIGDAVRRLDMAVDRRPTWQAKCLAGYGKANKPAARCFSCRRGFTCLVLGRAQNPKAQMPGERGYRLRLSRLGTI